MNLQADKQELFTALSRVINAIPSRPSIAILGHFHFRAEGDILTISGTDLDHSVEIKIKVSVIEAGTATIPAKKLLNIVRYLRDGLVNIHQEGVKIIIDSKGSRAELNSLDPEGYPKSEEFDAGREFVIKSSKLRKMFEKTSYAMANDETKGAMRGALLTVNEGSLACVATDGRRLAFIETFVTADSSLDGDIILPPNAVAFLKKNLDDQEEVRIHLEERHAAFSAGNMIYRSKLLEGNFPNYKQAIPTGLKYEISLPRTELISALESVTQILEKDSAVFLDIHNDSQCTVFAKEGGELSKTEISCRFEGEPVLMCYSSNFMLDSLKNQECEEVSLRFNDPFAPTGIYGDEGFICVIMPMKRK